MKTHSIYAVDSDWRGVYRVGGISALSIGIAYLVTIALYAMLGPCTSLFRSLTLGCLPGNSFVAWTIVVLSVLTDLLFLPLALSLYLALKRIDRLSVLTASGFVGMFVVLDLGVTWPSISTLIILAGNYATSSSSQQAAIVAAAGYASAVLAFSVPVYSILLLSLGILMMGMVKLKGIFGKITAYLGLVTGISGIVAVSGPLFAKSLGEIAVINAVLTTLWVFFVGYRLYRLGSQKNLRASDPLYREAG